MFSFPRAKDRIIFVMVAFGIFLIGGLSGMYVQKTRSAVVITPALRDTNSQYKFIKPLLLGGDSTTSRAYPNLESEIKHRIDGYIETGVVQSTSMYMRDLDVGQWMGVNENQEYAPASLYKVALMISYLKAGEFDPSILLRTIVYEPTGSSDRLRENSDIDKSIVVGQPYLVSDLLYRMITNSDNGAAGLLLSSLDAKQLKEVFDDLHLSVPLTQDTGETMSPKSYSLFFRILYNATYLRKDMSERALDLLSKTEFKKGIIAGVPAGTVVAHKFGHRIFGDNKSEELHDCGIVYIPNHPYFLCVMTRGNDANMLASVIADISRMTYETMKSGR